MKINPSVLEAIEALPDSHIGRSRREPTEEELELLRRYWRKKPHHDLARAMGTSPGTLLRWVRENLRGQV